MAPPKSGAKLTQTALPLPLRARHPPRWEHLVRVLTRHVDSMDDLMKASEEELLRIKEIGPAAANSIATFFADKENRRTIEEQRGADAGS